MKRRDFFKWMGAASSAAISACKVNDADKKLLPYLVPPEEGQVPGTPRYLNTTCTECPAHCGVEVKIREDKPVKLEGNPIHPVNQGALCARGQASLAGLYHPDRYKTPLLQETGQSKRTPDWPEATALLKAKLEESKEKGLKNIFLSSHTSGSMNRLIDEFCEATGTYRFGDFDIYNHNTTREANRQILGRAVIPHYEIQKADVLISLGADLLETFLSPVEWHRQIAEARKKNHLHWVHCEPYLSQTGSSADLRLNIRPGSEPYLLAYLIRNITTPRPVPGDILTQVPGYSSEEITRLTGLPKEKIDTLLRVLNTGKNPLLLSGGPATTGPNGPITARYTALLQWLLGTANTTVDFDNPIYGDKKSSVQDMLSLAEECLKGKIGVVIFAGPHGFAAVPGFQEAIKQAAFRVAMAERPNAISTQCDLVLPLCHSLESWGDAHPRLNLKSFIQPVIEPLTQTRSQGDILLNLTDSKGDYRDYLVKLWKGMNSSLIEQGFKAISTPSFPLQLQQGAQFGTPAPPYKEPCLFIVPSLRTYDGRGAGTALLAEIPDPMSAITYGRWAAISKAFARKRNLEPGDVIQVTSNSCQIEVPVTINPGLAPGVLTIQLDALAGMTLPLDKRSGEFDFCLQAIKVSKTGSTEPMAILAGAKKTGNRHILPKKSQEDQGGHHDNHAYTLYPPHEHKDYRWGLIIDLDACSGCSACVAACYIENNVPLVGKAEHLRGREMSWLRMEAYYNDPDKPEFLPMMCQQCDNAPCETVCPVYATYHNPEGLNAQIYNRCVGTRYCANNCPYKVRRFNWFDNTRNIPLYSVSNPDLSVRPKGVMEKCSFCIQRIRYAKDRAKDEGRKVKDGDIIPACAQTCPAGAITFGNLLDPGSRVSKLAKTAGSYRVQELLGTEPAVYYIKTDKKKKG